MDFIITNTNIVRVAADAIVLPANKYLKEGSGASRAIFEAAGRKELTQACEEIGHCDMGSAVVTLAYNLDAEYIIHAVVPKWIDGKHNEYELLSTAYLTALSLADVMECKTIAFPLLASGNNGFDAELSLRIANDSFKSFKGKNLQNIILVIYGDKVVQMVRKNGLKIAVLPVNLQAAKDKWKRQKDKTNGRKRDIQELKDIYRKAAMEKLKDPEFMGKLIIDGGKIVNSIIQIKANNDIFIE